MKIIISTVVVGLLTAIASGVAIAKPAPKPAPKYNKETKNVPAWPLKLGKRDVTSFYICTDILFQGRCQNLFLGRGECRMLS